MNENNLLEIPREFLCPITHELMANPVVAADGHSYERTAITQWYQRGHRKSPLTNQLLDHQTLTANLTLRKLINDYRGRMTLTQGESLPKTNMEVRINELEEKYASAKEKNQILMSPEEEFKEFCIELSEEKHRSENQNKRFKAKLNKVAEAVKTRKSSFLSMSMNENGKEGQNLTDDQANAADILKEQGNQSLSTGNFQKAIELYTQAIEIEKKAIFYANRSFAYFELAQFQNSLEDAEVAININKECAKGYMRKALALKELGEITGALEAVEKGCEVSDEKEISMFVKLVEEIEEEYKEVNLEIQELEEWLLLGGAAYDKLTIEHSEKDCRRGVYSTQRIEEDDLILFVPKTHLITLELAKQTPVAKKMIAAQLSLLSPKHSYLSTFLLDEKFNENSWWRPYMRMLPANFDSMPIFFSKEDLAWLEGSPFLDEVHQKKMDISKDYEAILKVAPEFGRYSFLEFCWARMNASSRIFGITIDGVRTEAFVPLADMLNHRLPSQTTWSYSDEDEGFIIRSLEDVDVGGQVSDSFGKKCNSRFLLNYGFIVLDNNANEVALKINFKNDDPCLKEKASLMQEYSETKTFKVMANLEENTTNFLNFLRFVNIRDNETVLEVKSLYENSKQSEKEGEEGLKPHKTPPLSIEIEQKVLEDCKIICEGQLKRYPTTLKKDIELLKSRSLTNNQQNCVLLRAGEKEILHYLIKFSVTCAPLLKMTSREIRKLTTESPYIIYAEYINQVIIKVVWRKECELNLM